jgi:thiamine-phosphate pyrophosphorylase
MLRLIDANLNRISEGLRILEDVARFLLNDAALSEQLKSLRHDLLGEDWTLQRTLLLARDSAQDVGAFAPVPSELERQDLPAIVIANARRAQESLRVLEEFAKLPDQPLDSAQFKKARFDLYEVERKLTADLLRRDKRERVTGLYVILDQEVLGERDQGEVAHQAMSGGAKAIQLRDKHRERRDVLATALKLKEVCSQFGALLIINDYLDIALASDADGLHLGQSDLPLPVARHLLPLDKLLGCSTTSLQEALQAQAEGADYIAVGSIYTTSSKADAVVVGLETLRQIKAAISLPIVAIGGINEGNAAQVIEAGADSVAVIGAVLGTANAEQAARQLTAQIGAG